MTRTDPNKTADVGLWGFCESLYSAPGIEQVCLQLQDEQGVNVLILLWCSWLEARGNWLAQAQFAGALTWVDQVSAETVLPVRNLRRGLKTESRLDPQAVQQMRNHLLSAELAAERDLLMQLETRFQLPGTSLSPDAKRPLELVLEHYQLQARALEPLRRACKSLC